MSRNSLEKVLYDLSTSSANKKLFAADPDKFLGRYQVTGPESEMVRGYRVREMADSGVNTMLTWGFWLQSGRSNREYLQAMKKEEA